MMKRTRLRGLPAVGIWLALVAMAMGVVVACGGGADPELSDETTSSTTSVPETTTTEPDDPTQPFTGLPLDDEDLLELRPVIAKYGNNDRTSQPHVNLELADIVFEEQIENSATRFAVLFHSQVPETFGPPLRSARDTDLRILSNLGGPILVDSGSNLNVKALTDQAEADGWLTRISDGGVEPFFRVDGRSRPVDLAADSEEIYEIAGDNDGEPTAVLSYGDSFSGVDSAGVRLNSRDPVEMMWDADDEQYLRFFGGDPSMVSDDEQMSTDNVVLLEVNYESTVTLGSPQALLIGNGPAWVLRDGQLQQGTWDRPAEKAPYALEDFDGEAIELKPGRTWVILAWLGSYEELPEEDAELLTPFE
ncbi:MAG: DUF3048 domain-containing protein [Acidobacteria bacterium]|nr:DUF3048 domain-containing protein [Acidobacteriota bacterium]